MKAPAFLMRLVMGELAQAALSSQRMIPQKLLDAGFDFLFPTIDLALTNLLRGEKG